MSELNYVQIIDYYRIHTDSINELMSSIINGINDSTMFDNEEKLQNSIDYLKKDYPFISMIYTLDPEGKQLSNNIGASKSKNESSQSGKDRSQRPYFVQAKESSVTATTPYLSVTNRQLCISTTAKVYSTDNTFLGYIVLDIGLEQTIEFMMGDVRRRQFSHAFKVIYTTIAVGLFSVVGLLFYFSLIEFIGIFQPNIDEQLYSKPFGIIIYLTLALAIFDLAKTILEEEVLMHKDIFRHSSTRRTITRFMAAILIAVSIESLLLMFKSAMTDSTMITGAVAMLLSSAGLLLALGVYVYLGAKAEAIMVKSRSKMKQ